MTSQHKASHEMIPLGLEDTASIDQQLGASLDRFEYTRTWERASVISVHPESHSCDLYTERGKIVEDVPWYNAGNEIAPPGIGTQWFVQFQGARATITPAPPMVGIPRQPKQEVSNVPGISSQFRTVDSKRGFHADYSGGGQVDVLPGDRILQSPSGNHVAILNSGICAMKSGEFCKVETHEIDSRVKLIGRSVELFTGPGRLTLNTDTERNKDGNVTKSKTSLDFAIGADEIQEANPRSENFRVRYRAGQAGNISCFQITDGKGVATYEHQIFPDGRVVSRAESANETIANGKIVGAGSVKVTSAGSALYKAGQRLDLEAGAAARIKSFGRVSVIAAGGNISLQSTRQLSLSAGAGMRFQSNGGLFPLPINRCLDFSGSNGSVSFSLGLPPGELPGGASSSSFLVNCYGTNGNIRLGTVLGGISLDSNLPKGVKIGGPALGPHPLPGYPGPASAVLYELLLAFWVSIGNLIDSHVHPTPYGSPLSMPPVVPPWNTSQALFAAARSNFVTLGG